MASVSHPSPVSSSEGLVSSDESSVGRRAFTGRGASCRPAERQLGVARPCCLQENKAGPKATSASFGEQERSTLSLAPALTGRLLETGSPLVIAVLFLKRPAVSLAPISGSLPLADLNIRSPTQCSERLSRCVRRPPQSTAVHLELQKGCWECAPPSCALEGLQTYTQT